MKMELVQNSFRVKPKDMGDLKYKRMKTYTQYNHLNSPFLCYAWAILKWQV